MAFPSAAQLLATDPLLLLSAPVDPGQRIALSLPGVPFASDWSGLLGPALRGSPDGRANGGGPKASKQMGVDIKRN